MKKMILGLVAIGTLFSAQAWNVSSDLMINPEKQIPMRQGMTRMNIPGTRADESTLLFGYCGDLATSLGTGQANVTLSGAIEIPEQTAASWAGSKITGMRIGFGNSTNKNVTIFLTYDLTGDPFYSENVTLNQTNAWNEVSLATPYVIEGKRFFVGYSCKTKRNTDYPIGVDYSLTSNHYGDYIGINNSWDNIGEDYGSICLQIYVTGDNLPQYSASASSLSVPPFVIPNEPFSASFMIANMGVKTITDVEVSAKVGGVEMTGLTTSLEPSSIGSGESGYVTVDGLIANSLSMSVPVEITITKLNGVEEETPLDNTVTSSFICAETHYPRNILFEEFTGTWCGWCPNGIVGMEFMRENYGDKGFIGIAAHFNDQMETSSYSAVINRFSGGSAPSGVMNRMYDVYPQAEMIEAQYLAEVKYPTGAKIDVTAEYSEATNTIEATATTEFAIDQNNLSYRIAFAIKEDNVGPYVQSNYYAGGSQGYLPGWSDKGSSVPTIFNEVARDIDTAWGIANSVPASVESGVPYPFYRSLSTKNVKDISNCQVIAMLLDTKTYEVINCAVVPVSLETSTVEKLSTGERVNVGTMPGAIVIEGNYNNCQVYTIDGKSVPAAGNVISVKPGMYVVKVTAADNNVVTKKVIVK